MKSNTIKKDFATLKKILKKHSKELEGMTATIDSKVKTKKPAYHLYGRGEVSIVGRKPHQTYLAGVIMQKNFAGFYFMPIYSHPKEFKIKNEDLRKSLKGKSCLNIKKLDAEMIAEIEKMIKKGIAIYRKEGWL